MLTNHGSIPTLHRFEHLNKKHIYRLRVNLQHFITPTPLDDFHLSKFGRSYKRNLTLISDNTSKEVVFNYPW